MAQDFYSAAQNADECLDRRALVRAIAREARNHGRHATIVGESSATPSVLVVAPDGEVIQCASARALAMWLGY